MKILISGASGNLGSLLTKYLSTNSEIQLVLMKHKTDIMEDIKNLPDITIRNGDLSNPDTLPTCLEGVDTIVHFAGVLFKSNPDKFLYTTNYIYFKNLVDEALKLGIKKIILISFPHVEGPTSKENPARGILDGHPVSHHARTRLLEEKYLFEKVETPISLRVGMVYGEGILMVDTAKWFASKGLLGVWKEETEIHLISKTDFCRATTAAIFNKDANGIYHLGDDGNDTLQSFLDFACETWDHRKPWRMPIWLIYFAASVFETFSALIKTRSPLTQDFIDIGRVSYYGDTSRMKEDLISELKFPTLKDGLSEFGIKKTD